MFPGLIRNTVGHSFDSKISQFHHCWCSNFKKSCCLPPCSQFFIFLLIIFLTNLNKKSGDNHTLIESVYNCLIYWLHIFVLGSLLDWLYIALFASFREILQWPMYGWMIFGEHLWCWRIVTNHTGLLPHSCTGIINKYNENHCKIFMCALNLNIYHWD